MFIQMPQIQAWAMTAPKGDGSRAFLDLVPHAGFVEVGGAGHMVAGDRNDLFNDAIVEFLRSVS